jgi:hypothetical protein
LCWRSKFPKLLARKALNRLKSDPATSGIPVVVYSCMTKFFTADGAVTCLQKSVMYGDFLAALDQAGVQPV